ncbi:MAG TPA: hypothetical protein VJB96_04195 [Patescibacteria group bacterium]|nr:hypothetical protein [Patescibacteria group bacterium]
MDPITEVPQKEHVVVHPELGAKMGEVTQRIEQHMAEPGADIAAVTGQMSMMAELGQLGKEVMVKRLGILFKDAKVALGVIPFVGKIGEWNTARIAGKTVDAIKDPKGAAAVTAANQELARKEESFVGKVNTAVNAETEYRRLSSAHSAAEKALTEAQEKLNVMSASDQKQWQRASDRLQEAQTHFQEIHAKFVPAEAKFTATQSAAMEKLGSLDDIPGKPKFMSKEWFEGAPGEAARKLTHSHSDNDFRRKYKNAEEHFKKHQERMQKKNKTFTYTQADILRVVANGDVPAFSGREKAKRVVKIMGVNFVLSNIGPIIDPIPDVPPLVAMGSWGVEAFAGQWWAGLIPPVWQYFHNRYAEFKLSFESSKKSLEIVKRHWDQKFNKAKEPQVARAAEVFMPEQKPVGAMAGAV